MLTIPRLVGMLADVRNQPRPLPATACLVAALLAGTAPAPGAFPEFDAHRIDTWGNKLGQTGLADIDRDGDLDWVAGCAHHSTKEVCWWEFRAPDRWVRHQLGSGNTDVGGVVFDADGDGWPDLVAGAVLLLNPKDPTKSPFRATEIGTIPSHDTEIADIDGDGRADLVSNSDLTGLYWYSIPPDVSKRWTPHTVATIAEHKVHGGVSPKGTGDVDGDGDTDIVTARVWYENSGDGSAWKEHRNIDFGEKHQYGIAVRTWVGDVDGDGDADFVQTECDNPDGRIAWFENDGRGHWTRHLIRDKGRHQDWHSLAVADFDGDGDPDVYSGAGPLSAKDAYASYIWENVDNGERWIEHELLDGTPCHEAEAADVDGDGDIDICTKPWNGGTPHMFLENRRITAAPAPKAS